MTAHVVIDPAVPPTQLGMVCRHCGGRLALALPVSIDEMGAATAAFDRKHRGCPPPAPAPTDPRGAEGAATPEGENHAT